MYEPAAEGSACDDGDACTVDDACRIGTCAGSPLACDAPPPPVCIDERTLRTFGDAGACSGGGCAYPSSDRACPDACAAGACTCVPVPWTLTSVPLGLVHSGHIQPFLAAAPSGEVHLVYRGIGAERELMHASGPPGGPLVPEVVPFPHEGALVEVTDVLFADGVLHVVLWREPTALFHGTRSPAGEWSFRTVDPEGSRGGALAIDEAGALHVAYTRRGDAWADLGYARADPGGAFATEIIEYLGEVGIGPSIALDDTGAVHIASFAPPDGRLRYATRSSPGASWRTDDVETGVVVSRSGTALLADASGTVHLFYSVRGRGLSYARRPAGGGWILEGAVLPGDEVMGDVVLDERGRLHAAASGDGQSRYGVRDETGAWAFTTLETGPMDYPSAIALDDEGGAHVAYFVSGSFTSPVALRYAYRRVCPD